MSMFHVGQRVRCISAASVSPKNFPLFLVQGREYHIRGFAECSDGLPGVFLAEINRSGWDCIAEPPFWEWRFRPVKDTSIEVFRSLLAPIPEEVA